MPQSDRRETCQSGNLSIAFLSRKKPPSSSIPDLYNHQFHHEDEKRLHELPTKTNNTPSPTALHDNNPHIVNTRRPKQDPLQRSNTFPTLLLLGHTNTQRTPTPLRRQVLRAIAPLSHQAMVCEQVPHDANVVSRT